MGSRSGRRLGAAVLAVLLVSGGCTSSREEPGLFGHRTPPPSPTPRSDRGPVEPTATELPVLGEQLWATGEGLDVTVRFAVHAIRRMTGATVLDWSVTPLASDALPAGSALPGGLDLGLGREDDGDQRIYLLDGDAVYRPLAHRRAEVFRHCLCTPLWAAQLDLRVGETRLLQTAFAPVPAELDRVDVAMANSMTFWSLPLTPADAVPVAARSTDLARPAAWPPTGTFRYLASAVDDSAARRALSVVQLETGPSTSTLTWRLTALNDQPPGPIGPLGRPVSATGPNQRVRSANVADGLHLRLPGGELRSARWITTDLPEPGYRECLCSQLGLWARGLRTTGGTVQFSTSYAPLPRGTTRVDVVVPGAEPIRDIAVVSSPADPGANVSGTRPARVGTWTYRTSAPPTGWRTQDWPTPLPDPAQLPDYRARTDRLVDPPPR